MNNKIITCAPLPPPHGGITNWYQILVRQAKKNNIEFLNVNTAPNSSENKRSLFNRVVVQGFRMLSDSRLLRKIVKDNKGSVAHIATSAGLGLIRDILFLRILNKNGVPAVYHLHFGRVPEILEQGGMECFLLKKTLSMANAIISIDNDTQTAIESSLPDKNVYYIPNPVDVVEASFKSKEEKNQIIYLGMVYKEKGIEELLSAWSSLTDKYPQWKLTLVGKCDDSYKAYLDKTFSNKSVEFKGYMPHDSAMDVLAESSFLVLPSYTEGFPNVVVEAMMCQKPVVATSVGAIPDMLSDNCGIVIPPQNVKMLSDSMETMITDVSLREQFGVNGREKALNNYASDLVFKKYMDVWETVKI